MTFVIVLSSEHDDCLPAVILNALFHQALTRRLCCGRTDSLVETVMEATSTVAEQQLPEATLLLLSSCGSICDSTALSNCLEALGSALGMQSA